MAHGFRFDSTRPTPLEVHLQSFNIPHFPSLMLTMAKPAFTALVEMAEDKPAILFVPSRKQCKLTANDLVGYCMTNDRPKRFLNLDEEELAPHLEHIEDQDLAECLKYGVGYYHEALNPQDRRIVASLMKNGAIQVLVASKVSQAAPRSRVPKLIYCFSDIGCCLEPTCVGVLSHHHGRSVL